MTNSPDKEIVDQLEIMVNSSVPCDSIACHEAAEWLLRYKEVCAHGTPIAPPYSAFACSKCLNRFQRIVNSGAMHCAACMCRMERLSHTLSSVERL